MTYDFGTGFSPVATFNAPLAEVADDPLDPALRRWNYHAGTQTFVSYEDAESIEDRTAFAASHGLRGAFTWQLAGDDPEHSLLAAMTRPFRA